MSQGLSEKEIIRLHRELVAPVAVHEILAGRDTLDETAQYTLDVLIAEFQPDTALLCIALCAAHVAQLHSTRLPIAGSLGFEASRIVHEYGPLWLLHADRRLSPAHESRVIDLLEQMPEDFEALADLLDAMRGHLIEGSDSALLCDMLSQNAHGFIDFLEHQAEEDKIAAQKSKLRNLEVHGNVITFPRPH
ncbi:MAG: hypothetical protein ACXW4B_08720 [Micavibrio sp.]